MVNNPTSRTGQLPNNSSFSPSYSSGNGQPRRLGQPQSGGPPRFSRLLQLRISQQVSSNLPIFQNGSSGSPSSSLRFIFINMSVPFRTVQTRVFSRPRYSMSPESCASRGNYQHALFHNPSWREVWLNLSIAGPEHWGLFSSFLCL